MKDIYSFKVIVIGDSGVGKTCYIQREAGAAFYEKYLATVGG